MYLIEEKGEVALYHDGYWVYAEYQDSRIKLNLPWNFNSNGIDHGWKAVSADFLKFPYHSLDYPTEDILLLWENGQDSWQALTFSTTSGNLTGLVSVVGEYYSNQELTDLHNSSGAGWYKPVADQTYFSTIGFYSGDPQFSDESRVPEILESLFRDIYTGIAKEDVNDGLPDLDSFDEWSYLASYTDLINAYGTDITGATQHYVAHGFKEGRYADTFDEWSYLASYTDLINNYGTDTAGATQHYVAHGFNEGRSADTFDEWQYLASHGDLITAFGSDITAATQHYVSNGYAEGRFLDNFDEWGYLASNNDLMNTYGSDTTEAIKHYISHGLSEGRVTNSFNVDSYLNNYADINSAFGHDHDQAKRHFIEHGFAEGRVF